MNQDYNFLANRISNLEKHVELLIEMFNEFTSELREFKNEIKADTVDEHLIYKLDMI
jgi:hypothetical protein